jgi:hypothetical protein
MELLSELESVYLLVYGLAAVFLYPSAYGLASASLYPLGWGYPTG